jgi:hypothetical protein
VLNPNYLLNSSFIFPDTLATATFAAGFLFLVLGRTVREDQEEGRLATLAVLLAGVLFGWTYLVRELSPILLPAVVAAVVLLHYPLRRVLVLAGAALATASLELLYGLVGPGDPLARVHELLERGDKPIRPARRLFIEHLHSQLNDPLDSVLVFPRLLLSWDIGWLFLLLIGIFAVALVRFRDRRLWLFGAWSLSFWAVMVVFGLWRLPSGDLIVNVTNIRYWYPIFPALLMGAFGSLALLGSRSIPPLRGIRVAHVLATGLAALALIPGSLEFSNCAAKDVWRNEPAERWHELRSWFASPRADAYGVIWSDNVTQRLVPAYTSTTFGRRLWEGTVKRLPSSDSGVGLSPLRRSLVLVHRGGRLPTPWARRLERDWSPVFVSDDGSLILLAYKPAPGASVVAPGFSLSLPLPVAGEQVDPGTCGLSPYESGG